jgi:hypothetical protein
MKGRSACGRWDNSDPLPLDKNDAVLGASSIFCHAFLPNNLFPAVIHLPLWYNSFPAGQVDTRTFFI